jgi:hypothetical protein
MDPISIMMLAQAGVSVAGSIYGMFAANANAAESKRRQQQRYLMQKEQLALQKADLLTSLDRQKTDLASSTSQAQASDAQSGRYGVSPQTVVQDKLEVANAAINTTFNAQNEQLDLQSRQIEQGNFNALDDINTGLTSSYIQGAGSILGTVLGSAADIYSYESALNPVQPKQNQSTTTGMRSTIAGNDNGYQGSFDEGFTGDFASSLFPTNSFDMNFNPFDFASQDAFKLPGAQPGRRGTRTGRNQISPWSNL